MTSDLTVFPLVSRTFLENPEDCAWYIFKCYILFKRIKALMLFSCVLVAVLCALMAEILRKDSVT